MEKFQFSVLAQEVQRLFRLENAVQSGLMPYDGTTSELLSTWWTWHKVEDNRGGPIHFLCTHVHLKINGHGHVCFFQWFWTESPAEQIISTACDCWNVSYTAPKLLYFALRTIASQPGYVLFVRYSPHISPAAWVTRMFPHLRSIRTCTCPPTVSRHPLAKVVHSFCVFSSCFTHIAQT